MKPEPAFPSREAAIQVIQRELTAFARRARGRAAELHPGLSLVAASILDLIIDRDGCLAAELAEHFLLDKSTVSRQVASLEQQGYLAKEVDPANRRNHILRATAAGKRVAREAERSRRGAFTERLHDWDDHDIAQLARYLMRYNAPDNY
ncbi:winged helix-turn-helix transcriptional regulator [Nocardia terpenica]|uniref:MarR family transcriptional regulator n=1 Tax=Nocardia terpenica TaxID=455432 RepID=A0A164MX18_9NOCA|nr:MarR family winged helix-turn-helix transcriptional regulator [Nocardia terpenica]KZM73746.1 MarR family transcriptional regulator [Nocardia terpenica]MBF6064466.1 winged helix-turn-helix transcriptional regulator [Nocardia terpenica]MBF6106910.1 winged helix-turn-helix transcriptional regulator [Nocardia terpenica]MBF6114434.1 winged helix-turn-helix transcriptional regulator [Nocardia terpenica]MBF6121480.1 winged helix-turn-helix transcriptional regulator [Nocardia terpenica]